MTRIIPFILFLFLLSCRENNSEVGKLFLEVPNEDSGLNFSNDLSFDGDLNILEYNYFFNGGGVAAGDLNNNGLIDLFFTGNQVSNQLYINKGNLKFENHTEKAGLTSTGWSSGVTLVDINADGWLDIYVCRSGSPKAEERKNLLYINQKDGTFMEQAEIYGLADDSYSTQAVFFDYDGDGFLDMYLLNHMHQLEGLNTPKRKKINGESPGTDKLFRNNGIGPNGHPTFTDVSREAGILIEGFGLGVGISDFNQDGWPDIYVSNDFISNDILYINNGDGTFTNQIAKSIGHQSHNGMGVDLADINNDGLTDILVLDMLPSTNYRRKKMLNKPNYDFFYYQIQMGYEPQYMRNTLQLNQGTKNGITYFGEVGQYSGISSTDWSWAGLFADYDLDGQKDLFVTNGYLKDMTDLDFINYRRQQSSVRTREQADSLYLSSIIRLPEVGTQNFLYRNDGNLKFTDVSKSWAPTNHGFSNGAIYADLDNDGDLDLVTNNINSKAILLKNITIEKKPTFRYLNVKFDGPENNTFGIGSKVWIYYDNMVQFVENYPTRGFQSSIPPEVNFGLGKHTLIDSLKVVWPDGKSQVMSKIHTNSQIRLAYMDAEHKINRDVPVKKDLFERIVNINLDYVHKDLDFSDYRIEPLLPHKFSYDGPSIAVADINDDGLDDVFIGGSHTFPGKLFKQMPDGSFDSIPWGMDKKYEDLGALFIDVDGDGYNDLYVVSGSNEFENDKSFYQDRLYINNGKGQFTKSVDALPEMESSTACILAADYNNDGQLDLFIGGRVVPREYGRSPKSYLLKNQGGVFIDVTKDVLGENRLGMVTASLWTDVDNDGQLDLVVVGEWMPVTIYKNNNGGFTEKIEIKNTFGMWNSIVGGDFDNDGDIDYIVGNLGENSEFKATPNHPMKLYLGDFDKDGKQDPIMTTFVQDENGALRSFPFVTRDQLTDQMYLTKQKFPFYEDYAHANITDLVPEDMMTSAIQLQIDNLQSIYIENLGNGEFKVHALPFEAQLSPIKGITVEDFNLDGNLDVLLSGNFHQAQVDYGQYDAFKGLLLLGNGKGEFIPSDFRESGFFVPGDARGLARLSRSKDNLILAAQNKDSLLVYRYDHLKAERIAVPNNIDHGILSLPDGRSRKIEIYRGEGYLSQSTRSILIPNNGKIEWIKKMR